MADRESGNITVLAVRVPLSSHRYHRQFLRYGYHYVAYTSGTAAGTGTRIYTAAATIAK